MAFKNVLFLLFHKISQMLTLKMLYRQNMYLKKLYYLYWSELFGNSITSGPETWKRMKSFKDIQIEKNKQLKYLIK